MASSFKLVTAADIERADRTALTTLTPAQVGAIRRRSRAGAMTARRGNDYGRSLQREYELAAVELNTQREAEPVTAEIILLDRAVELEVQDLKIAA